MFETMYAAPGIGLAATQVDVHKRVIVIDVSKERDEPLVFINPEILVARGRGEDRGGLPVGARHLRRREARGRGFGCARRIATAQLFERDFEDVLAVCIQHEMDHLEGKLFVDYLSDLKRERIRKKLDKERKERSAAQPAASGARRAY